MDTSLIRTLRSVRSVSVLERFDCIRARFYALFIRKPFIFSPYFTPCRIAAIFGGHKTCVERETRATGESPFSRISVTHLKWGGGRRLLYRLLYIQFPSPIQLDLLYAINILTKLRSNICRGHNYAKQSVMLHL